MSFAAIAAYGTFLFALLVAFLAAVSVSGFMISSMTVLQLSVPDQLRGRVMGIHSMGFSLMPLGALLLGALAERLGAAPAVWLVCAVYLLAVLGVALRQRVIRDLNGPALAGAA